MLISVVLPTYNRADVLPKALEAIFKQDLSQDECEVIIVDDGSTDGTLEFLGELKKKQPLRLLAQAHKGPAAARNNGIKEATGKIIVLIQDDIIAQRHFLSQHLEFHHRFDKPNTAVVGFTTWHPDLKMTPFMHWLEHGGPQFDYDRIKGKLLVDHLAFYTSNLSLRRAFILENGLMDEDFYAPGSTAYEDTEWGFRLIKRGLKLYFNPRALAYHYHPRSLKEVCNRRFHEGRMSHLLYKKHPDLKMKGTKDSLRYQVTHLKTGFLSDKTRFWLTRFVLNKYIVLPFKQLAYFCEKRVNFPLLFKMVCGYYYNQGFKEGLR